MIDTAMYKIIKIMRLYYLNKKLFLLINSVKY